ncbi:glycosyl hydrolase family 65 protein [Robertmurraya kyonggiensis]|uniref:glycosyl hydrolase family 65 protein n=1 Tax=Robertmurraya kyonggiensis TaxID=1037680 RepID=UPI002482661C|nr:glycosyl hydrolase family 65 protein [Robertmurraya kyonggiensis]
MLPAEWNSLTFHLQYLGRTIQITLNKESTSYLLEEGEALTIHHDGQEIALETGIEETL